MSQYMFMCQKEDPLQIQPRYGLTKNGGCILANNSSNIPQKELNYLLEIIAAQYFSIVSKWKEHFLVEDVKFYC